MLACINFFIKLLDVQIFIMIQGLLIVPCVLTNVQLAYLQIRVVYPVLVTIEWLGALKITIVFAYPTILIII